MGLLEAIGFCLVVVSLTQIHYTRAQGCAITSITAESASSLRIKWNKYDGATNYLLDLRVINSTDIAPVVVTLPASSTEKLVHGLRPGTKYRVAVKVFQFYYMVCMDRQVASTVPRTSQITYSRALSSSSIQLEWAKVPFSERYYLVVESLTTGEKYNFTFTNVSIVVENLQPSTAYNCSIYTANEAGQGRRSRVRTIMTLVQPPVGVTVKQTGKQSARVSWEPVEKVLLYEVTIRDLDEPNNRQFMANATDNHLDIDGLLPCSTYLISVCSVNAFLEPGEPTDFTYTTNTLSPVTSISVDYSCNSGTAMVSWSAVFGADSYRARAIDNNGTVLSCTSPGTECQIPGVGCGQNYVVHVTPMSENCEHMGNVTSTVFQTVPCPPENLKLHRECSSNVIIFSWEHTNQTDYYLAKAVDSQGVVQDCMTTENSCFFTDTVCGRRYTFTVYSISGDCRQISSAVDIRTAPCMPKNVHTSADCKADVLVSTWDRAEGALSYTVEALGNKGRPSHYNCSSFTNSCAMLGVHCGEHLTIYITAFDDECPSSRTLGKVAETVPCVPQNFSATMDCGADSITMNWESTAGALFYSGMAKDSRGVIHTCQSVGTSCQIRGLMCGSTYTASVTASNLQCNSSYSDLVTVETAACPPGHIEASLDCAANQAVIGWNDQPNMMSYTATMVDTEGGLLSCNTTESSCRIPSLKCGQLYAVSVYHHDGICPSIPSEAIYMESVPCGPANVQTTVNCLSGELNIGWKASRYAEGYTSIISDGSGQMLYCNSTEPRCSMNMLECGQEYKVEVMSVNGTCFSLPSETMIVREVPCVPTDVVAERNCGESSVDVMWQASRPAKNYTAVALDGNGHRSECSTNGMACSLDELTCGQVYSISVVAMDDACSSVESAAVTLETVPCSPSQLNVSVDCASNSAQLAWDTSPNAVAYCAKAVCTDGHSVSCNTTGSQSCMLEGLHCGQEYVFTVSASDGSCHSPESQGVAHITAPCAPQTVVGTMDCNNNTLFVDWAPASIPLNYSTTALARDGSVLTCMTEGSGCQMNGLKCGQEYILTVKAAGSQCEGPSSVEQTVQSVPCVPGNVRGPVECPTNTVQASWEAAAGALSYLSTLSGAEGFSASCLSARNRCSFRSLECAQEYTLTVATLGSWCNSSVTAGVSLMTAPCDPEHVTALLHCRSGVVTVTWEASAGAVDYTVLAQPAGKHHLASCKSTSTSCELNQLQCGEVYNVTVLAGDGICNSSMLATTTVKTAPCLPVIQEHSLDCTSNHVSVSWAEDEHSVGFIVNATSSLGHSTSCSSVTNTSCVLDDLRCGQTYTVHTVAQGDRCDSMPSESFEIVTAPCTPANVESAYTCGTSIALLSWDETLGRETFYVRVEAEGHMDFCNTAETHCSLSSLLCGQLYNVTVDAVAAHCNSSLPASAQIQTAPCAPQNVSASLVCDNNTAAVSWVASPGAVGYKVTALGRDSDSKHCTTNTTSCDLPNMHCAQTYEITVSSFSDTCKGFDSTTFTFIAGPCPPTDVQVSLECEGNVGSVSWAPALVVDLYVATATADDGHTHTCNTSGTGCSFTDLHCGEIYSVTVINMDRGCQSAPSAPVTLKAAICPPTNVKGVTACETNDIIASWDQSPESGVTYILHFQKEGGANTNYFTAEASKVITGLQCGKRFSIRVSTQDSVCVSALSQPVQMDTAPCPPTNLTTKADCGTNKGTMTWQPSAGAVTYTAMVTSIQGKVTSCSSNTTSCFVKLDCGQHYSAVVVGSTAVCNSTMGDSVRFESAPCLPDQVVADLDCNANSFAVRWRQSEGHVSSYMAIAIGSDGTRATCNTPSTACTIETLQCGLTYSIAVTTASINCGTIDGSDYKIQSAPCKPENPVVDLECSSNNAQVSWENAGPDQVHVVSAVDRQALTTTCNSSASTCAFSQLSCGKVYRLSVVGHTELCSSRPSRSLSLHTAPCVPTHLKAEVDCQTGITVVTWDPAEGALMYMVYANGSGGHSDICTHSDTICVFPDLPCGQDYIITVMAQSDSCNGLVSDPITTTTGPCPHTDLKTSLDCTTNTALVSWTPGSGMLSYNASAEGFDIAHHLTCSTHTSACNISSLRCGERYRVSVRGEGRNCPSPARDWTTINTAPCPPTQLKVETSCDSDTISVSWAASQGSVTYMAVAESTKGHRLSCNTSSTACQVSGLLCGQEYQVYAAGTDENCVGAKSAVHVIHTAPCVPLDVQNQLDCLNGVLTITWQQSGDAHHFHATVQSSKGHVSVCDAEEHRCVVPSMQCGLNYSVVVVAHDEACNSSHSHAQQVTTAPCPLESFDTTVDCATNVVKVTWNGSVAGVLYGVSAVDPKGHRHNCSATGTGCDLSMLECGTEYNITITPSRDGCVGRDSPYQLVRTAPCVPHLTDVEMDCLSESAWVMMEESAGAEFYFVVATNGEGESQRFECNATDGVCTVPDMKCGQHLNFTLLASDQQCSSTPSNVVMTETAPCPPQDVHAMVGCKNRIASVSWLPSYGAVMYTATLERMDGETTCCTTNDTGCDVVDLPCGELYVLMVTAEGRTCNSSQSRGTIIRTEPCIPQNLQASLSCSSNVANMQWNHSRGGQQYRVKALGMDGHRAQCISYDNHCELTDLHCGQHYNATVVAENSDCTSGLSDSVDIRTVPCIPVNVSALVDCDANCLSVSWAESAGADSYIATVEDGNGLSTSCQAMTEGSCNVTALSCGEIYHVSVVSSDGYCNSSSTEVVDARSVPCEPCGIMAVMDCASRTASISWYACKGAVSYTVVAATASGHAVTCDTTRDTHCVLGGLACGQSYTVSVQAKGETCSNMAHMAGQLVTEPCLPQHITTRYSLSIGQVTWDQSVGAVNYTAEGLTNEGLSVSCTTSDTYCALYNMVCGQVYNVTVTAHNQVCRGVAMSSQSTTIKTEPCPPRNVQTRADCEGAMGTVSWEMSLGAVGYMAYLDGRDGHSLSCHTLHTFCSVKGLHCGTVYYTRVVALGETDNSTDSTTVLLVSAPCAAEVVEAELDCDNDMALVSWSWIDGAQSYLLTATGSDGHRASCETAENNCNMTELQCGQMYNLSLTAINDHCRTKSDTGVRFSTRPCVPRRVGVDLQCGTSTANLYWEPREGVEVYMATATCTTGETMHCNSTGSSCQFSSLYCGESYQFSISAHSNMCQSKLSSTVEIRTEPCQPNNMTVSGSCDNDTVVLDWLEARGASVYVVSAMGNLGYYTAFQTNETSLETAMPCGQTYSFTVRAQGDRCDSPVSQPTEFTMAPCAPYHVESYTQCENSLGSISWGHSDGADFYTAVAVGQDGHTHMCSTIGNNCTWDDLHCGERYVIHVIANDDMCSSAPSNSTSIRMAPCVPQNLESSLDCSTKVGLLTWNASEAAESYIVTAETNGGHKVQLKINETSAHISEFLCGKEYFLSVEAVDSVCRSNPSLPARLTTVPCPPTNVSSSMDCLSNIAVVTWTTSAGAEFYIAMVTNEDVLSGSCMSANKQCGMPNLTCGQNYTVTVTASNQQCNSDPSEPGALQSVPCVPTDVEVTMGCSHNIAVVSWNASQGALLYKVVAQTMRGAVSTCESTDPGCTLTNLACGEAYFLQVVAMDDICSSLPSQAAEFHTVPCTPEIGVVVLDCFTNSALLEWAYSMGAVSYTAMAQSAGGHVSTCTTNYTNCELLELQCGQTYTVTMVASNTHCDSNHSASVQVTSVPCPPEAVVTILDCSTNTARVEWQGGSGADSYTVLALGVEEDISGCETDSHSCMLQNLMCGFTYNISVIAINSECNVSESTITQIHTVPCIPNQVMADLDCESGAVSVSWESSNGAASYMAVAQGNAGYMSTCNSSQTTCQFSELLCGLSYSITVTASNDICTSAESGAVQLNTVSCVPQKVAVEMECSSDTGLVSWEQGEGVASYLVNAVGPDGHSALCNSSDTSCRLPSMHCGQRYNLTVTAQDGQCDNSKAYLNLQSVPCRPTNVQASLQCLSNSVAVTWEHASGAVSYKAVGVTADGSHEAMCNNTVTHCELSGLLCGQTYNVSVFGQDESCNSMESDWAYIQTAPCMPQDVAVDLQCAAGAMTVSWSPNPDADSFRAVAVSSSGPHLSCDSSGLSCSLENMTCGHSLSITVVSIRDDCESQPSTAVQLSSAPCVPRNLKSTRDCVTNAAWVSWDDSNGALSYTVVAKGVGGHNSSCTSSSTSCNVPDLECGTLYTFHVTAANELCRSDHSSTFQLETGPCALTTITAVTECHSNKILVNWELTRDSQLYLVTAEGHDQSLISCNSSTTSCELMGVRCGMQYTVIVSASSDKCSSLRSPPKKIHTAPCVPEDVISVVSCDEGGAMVSWAPSVVATSFLLTATPEVGDVRTCNTSSNNCTLVDLHCGQLYTFSVTASTNSCTSQPSADISFKSVPCEPSGLSVSFHCETNLAVLSWGASEGSMEYFGSARSEDGDMLYCNSMDTSCTIQGLECGDMYNFSVEASDGLCNSSFSAPLLAGAAPCAPATVKVQIQLIDEGHWAMVSWSAINCADKYLVEITGRIQDHPQALMEVSSYWVDRLYFEFPMPCSTAYNITIRSRNSVGLSEPSDPAPGITVPCAPQDVTYTSNSQSATLSWEPSVFATQYTVYNTSGGARVKVCQTEQLFCQMTSMEPGAIEVTAMNSIGESFPTTNITGPVVNRRR